MEVYNWLVYKITDKYLGKAIKQFAHGKLLDIGCGNKPYKNITTLYVKEHIGLDHCDTIHNKSDIDIFGTAYKIPQQDSYFDTILCTAVLEHLEEPGKAIAEANRVLKQGGYAIYTIPLFWHLHEEPRDFYRYTKNGIKYLFEKNGFSIVELKPLSGFWVTFGQEFVYYIQRFGIGGKINPLWWIILIVETLVQSVCYILNKYDHSTEFTWAYILIAKKI